MSTNYGITDGDDYYAFLNVSRNATIEEIRNSFRLLSRQFHPDKHNDPALKRQAELMFDKLKKVYDVLSDPDKRSVYDALGASGLSNNEGWALVEKKFKSAKEIKEEYEQLLKEKEERLIQQRTSPKGTITVLIDATNLFTPDYDDDDDQTQYYFSPTSLEIRSMSITQSIDSALTLNNHVVLNGYMNVRNGIGSGSLSLAYRHIFNPKTWTEIEFGAGQGPTLSFRGFRSITPNLHFNCSTSFHASSIGVRAGLSAVLTRQFSKHFVGYLSYKAGIDSSMGTTVVYENEYCRVNGSIQLGYQNSFLSSSYTHKFKDINNTRIKVGLKLGILGTIFDYGCETKLSQYSTIGAAITVGSTAGVNLRVKLVRNNQSYIFPILLAEELAPGSIVIGTIVPLITYYLVKTCVIDVYIKRKEQEELEKEREENASFLKEKRQEAINYTKLMNNFYQKILEREELKNGLIIEHALYGNESSILLYEKNPETIPSDANVFDFKVALQVLVTENSKLQITSSSKSFLPGFYDPYLGGVKKLLILYKFNKKDYRVLLDEHETATLPFERHLILPINEDHFN